MRIALAFALVISLGSVAHAAPSSPTLSVSPSVPHVSDVLSFSGCGYQASRDYALTLYGPGDVFVSYQSTRAATDGCITFVPGDSPQTVGAYSAYVAFKTGSGVGVYGHHKPIVDYDFDVT